MSSVEIPSVDTVPDIVNTIMDMLRRVTKMLSGPRNPVEDKTIAKEQRRLEHALREEQTAVASVFNICIVALGTSFSSGDDVAIRELREALAVFGLPHDDKEVTQLQDLQRSFSEPERLGFTQLIYKGAVATKTALQELGKRNKFLVEQPSQYASELREQVRIRFPSYGSNAVFCEGALHLQKHSLASISDITAEQPGGGGYACHHCGLDIKCMEINLKGAIIFDEAEWKTLAACHMQAHFSFKNFAAWYMCRLCHNWGLEPPQVFVSPVAMIEHLKNHPKNDISVPETGRTVFAELP